MTDSRRTECIICGQAALDDVSAYRCSHQPSRAVFGGHRIARCAACGLLQIDPVPSDSELDRYYRAVYRKEGFNAAVSESDFPYDQLWYLSRGRALCRLLEEWNPAGASETTRVMDVGAGFGHALWSLRESRRTYELYACEPDPACHGFLRRCGARIFPVALNSQAALSEPLTHAPYDALIVSHVLEHVTRPTSWLAMLSRLLRAGGLMLLEVPHDPMRETRWTRNHAPHVSFFDEESLRECITRSGGTVLFAQTCGPCLPSLQAPWRRAALRAAHLMIPGGLRGRLGRAIDRRRVRSSGTTSAIPLPEFGQYGGPERMFLRAVVTFHTPERSSQVLAT